MLDNARMPSLHDKLVEQAEKEAETAKVEERKSKRQRKLKVEKLGKKR